MAKQRKITNLKASDYYLEWLKSMINYHDPLADMLFDIDFYWDPAIQDDMIRADKAMDLRHYYAEAVSETKDEHDIHNIWKTIHGRCSLLEVIISLAKYLDETVNEGNDGDWIPIFFRIMIHNCGWDQLECEELEKIDVIFKAMKREFNSDGSGWLFPLRHAETDQRKEPIWNQLNSWLCEHLDDDAEFMIFDDEREAFSDLDACEETGKGSGKIPEKAG